MTCLYAESYAQQIGTAKQKAAGYRGEDADGTYIKGGGAEENEDAVWEVGVREGTSVAWV